MGNYRFKLSELIPNAWFYKLKDMSSRARKQSSRNGTISHSQKKKQQLSPPSPPKPARSPKPNNHPSPKPRKSYHITRDLNEKTACSSPSKAHVLNPPPTKQRLRHKKNAVSATETTARSSPKLVSSSVSAGCSCRSRVWASKSEDTTSSGESSVTESLSPELRSDHVLGPDESLENSLTWPSPCSCSTDVRHKQQNDKFLEMPELELRPIVTKPPPDTVKKKHVKEPTKPRNSTVKKSSVNSPGLRLRLNSPRVSVSSSSGRKSFQGRRSTSSSSRRSLSDSFAVIKASVDPMRDFKESMVEMIVENNIKRANDLEELLACYLSLNSDEYHETIIKVFKQIWVDLCTAQMK